MSNLLMKIATENNNFSKGQKCIADFVIKHYDKAAFMTAGKLGQAVGVSESTVVRFATELGFDGYPHLQCELQQMVRNKLTAVQRMEVANDRLAEHNILRTVLASDIEKIRITLDEINEEEFEQVLQALLKARRIYVLGSRSSSVLANFLGFYLKLIFDQVFVFVSNSCSEIFEQLYRADENDVVLGISFPRYSRSTSKVMQYGKDQGATVLALTDSRKSPIGLIADYSLIAKSDMASFVDSLVAPLSVINALIVAIGMRKQTEISDTFHRLEKIWDEYEVYDTLDNEDNHEE